MGAGRAYEIGGGQPLGRFTKLSEPFRATIAGETMAAR